MVMKTAGKPALGRRQARLIIALGASLFVCAACNHANRARMTPLDAAGMHPETIEQLNKYQLNDAEVQQILTVGRAGMSEQECVELVRLARSRDRSFAEGDAIAGMIEAGVKQDTILELIRLDELTAFGGEAEAMHLAGLSDAVILDVARRKAKGEVVLTGSRLAELRDAGFSNAQLVAALDQGFNDKQAQEALTHHNYAVGGHSFVRQRGR
jgi:hypothetical protein